ncbi:hypothetical protein CSA80_03620 [Candidatus Saccharibacteria bacterium]|nr:MAG: hypothetical protein CR973_01110 [Candidatus Saccharibacteria bacterium]PID99176.1 MAG: hypothetical protein CSA80_03620 [Candidatus Saccharibacteria bacterium]
MRLKKQWSAVFCLVTLMAGGGVAWASRTPVPMWLSSVEPRVEKVSDLPDNQGPFSLSQDCIPIQLPNGASTMPIDTCEYVTPLGLMANSILLNGPSGTHAYDPFYGGNVLPSIPGHPNMLITATYPRSWIDGANLLRIGTYSASQLRLVSYYGLPPAKKYQYHHEQPNTVLRAPNGEALHFRGTDIAYATNGKWMAAIVSGKGIYRYDLENKRGKLIAWHTGSYQSSANAYRGKNNLAISENGRFVAVTLSVPSNGTTRPALRVYDVFTCPNQHANQTEPTAHNGCEYKDLWSGEYRTGNTRGLRDVLPTAEYPRRVRFVKNNVMTFDTVYDRTGPASFKVARYQVTMPKQTAREYVGVLGMGDSYISGEGVPGTYFTGTDTRQNKCHLSWYSYPFRINAKEFHHGRSVACSGAKLFDVSIAAGDPRGEVVREDDYEGQVGNKKEWNKRGKNKVIDSFSPGYAQQTIFARKYKPRTILLSIGGNDIGFAKILTSCITGGIVGTCYQYYEDRVQVMEQILGQYDRLVATYKDVLAESGGARVYVVGYPQIFKEGGNCGVNVRFNAAEVRFASRLITYFNSIIKRATAEAGVYYVDTEAALNGHRLCEASKNTAGVNGLTNGNDKLTMPIQISGGGKTYAVNVGIGNESYHPTLLGHRLIARRILANTTNLTELMPTPIPNNKPDLDYTSALLKNVDHAPEQLRPRGVIKWTDSGATLFKRGGTYQTNLPKGTVRHGATMKITLRSEPITLLEGVYDENVPATFAIPESTPTGFHTLDIYTTSAAGAPIDLRQVVFVAENADDFDGDGIKNDQEACLFVDPSGIDEDSDGIDDACDGELRDELIDETQPGHVKAPASFDETEGDGGGEYGSQDLAVPYVPSENESQEENAAAQNKKKAGTSIKTAENARNTGALARSARPDFLAAIAAEGGAGINGGIFTQPKTPKNSEARTSTLFGNGFERSETGGGAHSKLAYFAGPVVLVLVPLVYRKVRHLLQ